MTILVVDDNDLIANVFSEAIRLAGYDVDVANSGTEAIAKLKINNYRLAFVDLSLPDVNGVEVAIDVRRFGINTPMIAVSGAASLIDPVRLSTAGFELLLPKPIRVSTLIDLIQERVGARAS